METNMIIGFNNEKLGRRVLMVSYTNKVTTFEINIISNTNKKIDYNEILGI